MKKFYKITGTIAGILAMIGLVLCIIGAVSGARAVIAFTKDNGFKILSGDEIWKYEDMNMEAFSSIHIDSSVADVRIVQSSNVDQYGVKCEIAAYKENIQCKVENGELYIVDGDSDIKFSLNLANIFSDINSSIIIYVPEGESLDNVYLNSDVGDVKIDGITTVNSLEIGTDVGDIKINDGTYKNVNIHTNVGDIKASGIKVTNDLNANSDVGDVEINGEFACDVNIETNVGDIEFKTSVNESDYNYNVSGGAGDIEVFGKDYESSGNVTGNAGGKYNMIIKTELGDVEIE